MHRKYGIPTRRAILKAGGGALLMAGAATRALAASDFWNRKSPSQWSEEEIGRLTTHSPWARDVNADFELNADYTTNGAEGPSVGRGGALGAPGAGSGAPAQIEFGRNKDNTAQGARHRAPVIVRWESAQPILDAMGVPLSADFNGRYVLSVSGLPMGVMERRRRGAASDILSADPEENTAAARQRRMVEELQSSATLEARGREPAQAGMVRPVPRMPGTYLFGFSKELLPLSVADREIVFTLKTAMMSVRAKFEPKEMLYHGQLAL